MRYSARVENSSNQHQVTLQAGETVRSISIPPRETGFGSSVSGGEPARNLVYKAKVVADASEQEIRDLMNFTDTVAEVQNTVRAGTPVILTEIEAGKI